MNQRGVCGSRTSVVLNSDRDKELLERIGATPQNHDAAKTPSCTVFLGVSKIASQTVFSKNKA